MCGLGVDKDGHRRRFMATPPFPFPRKAMQGSSFLHTFSALAEAKGYRDLRPRPGSPAERVTDWRTGRALPFSTVQ